MKANILKRPIGKVITVWCAFATLTTSFTPAFASISVLPEAELNGYTGLNGVTSGSAVGKITGDGGDAVLDWNSLSIYKNHSLTFENGKSFYNVVSGSAKSELLGTLVGDSANVYIFNPNGILIGGNAQINVSGIFGAYAMGISRTTLDTWLENVSNVGSTKVESKNTGLVEVESGALIQAAAIELAGKGISLNNATFTTNGKEDESGNIEAVTKLTAGGMLVLDQVSGGRVSVDISDESSFATDGIDLMGNFSKALTVQTAANGNVKVVGKTTAGGDVTIEAGSISESDRQTSGAAIVTTDSGKLTATATAGDIVLDRTANAIEGEVSLTAEKGAVTFKNSAGTTLIGDVTAKSVTIEATKDLTVGDGSASTTVKATTGDIIIKAGNGLKVEKLGSVLADAGNTSLTAVNDLTVNGAAGAENVVKLESTGKDVTVAGAVAADGNVTVTAANDVNVNGMVAATEGDVKLTASAGSVSVSGGNVLSTEGDITINAKNAVSIAAVGANSSNVMAGGDVSVTAEEDGVTVSGTVTAGKELSDGTKFGGNVELTGKTVDVAGSVTANAALDAEAEDGVVGGNVTITATAKDVTVSGEITADKNVTITAANNVSFDVSLNGDPMAMVTAKDGTVKLDAQDGAVTINGATVTAGEGNDVDGVIDIDATSDVTIKGASSLTAKQGISVDTTTGSIALQDTASLIADNGAVALTATKGAVSVSRTSNDGVNSISATGGDVKLSGATDVEVTQNAKVIATAKETTTEDGITTTVGGNVELTATSTEDGEKNITIAGTVAADKSVKATAANNITIEGADAENKATVTATDGTVTIDAQKGAVTINNAAVTAMGENGTINASAKDNVTVKGASLLDAEKNISVLTTEGAVTIQDTAELAADNNLGIKAKNEVKILNTAKLDAGKGVTLQSTDSSITIEGTDKDNKATVTANDGKVIVSASKGAVTINNATVTAKKSADAAQDSDNGTISITALKNVEVKNGSLLDAAKDITVNTTAGSISVLDTSKLDAEGDVALTAKAAEGDETGNITVAGTVTAGKAVTATAANNVTVIGSVEAMDGNAELTAEAGKVLVVSTGSDKIALVSATGGDVKLSGGTGVEVAQYGKVSATAKTIATESSTTTVGGNVELTAMSEDDTLAADEKNVIIAGRVEGNGDITVEAKKDITVNATGSVLANKNFTATAAKNVTVNGSVTADKAVTLNSTTEGDILIEGTETDKATVTANDGKVTIDADNGAVTINNTTVTANKAEGTEQTSENGTIDIDATGTVTVKGDSLLDAAKDIAVDTTAGSIDVQNASTLDAEGDVTLTAKAAEGDETDAERNITVAGTVTADKGVKATAAKDITVSGNVTAKGGDATLTAEKGAVDIIDNAVVDAKENVTVEAAKHVQVLNKAAITADKAVTLKATDGYVTIEGNSESEKASVTANDGKVTIDADNGAVTIKTATITAAGDDGTIDIDATTGVEINNGATLNAAKDIDIATTGGDVTTADGTTLTAGGDLKVSAVNETEELDGNITLNGKVDVSGKTDLDAKGSIVADNAANDFKGLVDATATDGSVTLKDNDVINLNDVVAGDAVTVNAQNINVVAKNDSNKGVEAKNAVIFVATDKISVNNDVKSTEAGITFNAANGVAVNGTAEVNANENLTINTTAGNVTTEANSALVAGKDLIVKADNSTDADDGYITIGGTATVGETTALIAKKDISAKNEGNDFQGNVNAESKTSSITLVDKDDIKLNNINAATTVSVESKDGNIVVVENGVVKSAAKGIKLNAKNSVTVDATATITAEGENGNLDVDATTGSIEIKGVATVDGTTDLDAKGSIVADNTANDFKGLVDATATDGSVKLVDANTISLNDIDAGTTVDVKAKNIEVVANSADDTGVNAGDSISFKADEAITVNNEVTSAKNGVKFVAGTSVTVNDATVTADGDNGTITIGADEDVLFNGTAKLDANEDVSVTAGNKVEVNDTAKLIAGRTVEVSAQNAVSVASDAEVQAGSDVSMSSSDNDVAIAGKVTAARDAVVAAANEVKVSGSVTATEGKVDIDAGTRATVSGSVTAGGNASAIAKENITVSGKVVSNGGDVTLKATDGSVDIIDSAVVDANQNVLVEATRSVQVLNSAAVKAGAAITLKSTEAGDVKTDLGTSLTAGGDLDVDAVAGNITINGKAEVKGKTDLDAKGEILADNESNDFQGVVDATAKEGSVTLVDANDIKLNDIDAATTVDVTAEDIVVVANDEAGTGVNAGEGISFKADNSIAVNNAVRTEAGNIYGKTETGDITFGANGSMWANGNGGDDDGSVTLIAAKNIDSVNKGTAITAKDTINLYAGENIGSPLNVSAKYLNVDAGGSANIVMKKGVFNENGDLAVDDSKSSIKTGKDLKLDVEGNLSTPNGGVLRVGNNLDLTVNSATPEVNVTLGGSTITAKNKTQSAIAIKTVGGTQFPEVIGTDSDTAVIIDGRIAGGDSSLFSILESYEAQAAIGMTPDIRGAVLEKTPKAYYDQKLHVNDLLPHVWDEQIDDKEVVPQEVSSKDAQATDTVAMR